METEIKCWAIPAIDLLPPSLWVFIKGGIRNFSQKISLVNKLVLLKMFIKGGIRNFSQKDSLEN